MSSYTELKIDMRRGFVELCRAVAIVIVVSVLLLSAIIWLSMSGDTPTTAPAVETVQPVDSEKPFGEVVVPEDVFGTLDKKKATAWIATRLRQGYTPDMIAQEIELEGKIRGWPQEKRIRNARAVYIITSELGF